MNSNQRLCAILLLFLIVALSCMALSLGKTPWSTVWSGVKARCLGETELWNPLIDERLPRLIVILCTGASLAVSGAVMQALFHNPLASPSVLGISSGGSLAVVFVYVMHWHFTYPYAVPFAAVTGSLSTLLVVYGLSQLRERYLLSNLILTGIAVSTLLVAVQGVIMYALRNHWQLIQTLTEWEAGSTADRSWKHVHMQLPLAIIGLFGSWYYRYEIDILALGDEEARNLGVEVEKVRWRLFLCVALLTGGALAAVGIIAFFGLVLPHVMRRLIGTAHSILIPFCLLAGMSAFLFLDNCIRLLEIHIFSIGNISAILGGLFFLMLLFGGQQKRYAWSA